MEFDFTAFAELSIQVTIDTLEAYGDLTQMFPVETIINTAPPGALTPQTEELLRYIWDHPELVEAGKQELLSALRDYDPSTILADVPGLAGDGSTPTTPEEPTTGVVTEVDGLNVVTYTLPYSGIEITVEGNTAHIFGAGIDDTLTDLDRLEFLDGTVALDYDGSAGDLYAIYGASLNREPDSEGFRWWLDRLDAGAETYQSAAEKFIVSEEFQATYGALVDNAEAFIEALYSNILGREADDSGFSYWTELYAAGDVSVYEALVGFSASAENMANIQAAFADGFFF
ncbi:hypothetical protein GCM10007989_30780 [Devosia pacifica]|uniref:DUF4214 domain-containing protein n=1 Tax=Devosia pacifica TaxID=1335967 RepID=A0A918SD02_9HYPH|nr:DUF4214 domain-containing protein [Devosia pacifica]GHA32533.1 hypothetical protein GCM10007989_30780 [Devosia pacifica]